MYIIYKQVFLYKINGGNSHLNGTNHFTKVPVFLSIVITQYENFNLVLVNILAFLAPRLLYPFPRFLSEFIESRDEHANIFFLFFVCTSEGRLVLALVTPLSNSGSKATFQSPAKTTRFTISQTDRLAENRLPASHCHWVHKHQ